MNIKTFTMTCGLTVCLLAQPVAAGAIEDGQAAFDRKDYALAVRIWRPLADQGDAEAQYNIGLSYMSNDLDEAARWYGLAADQGNAKAQFALGNIYAVGHGVPKDLVKAYKWFNLAADSSLASGTDSPDAAIGNLEIVAVQMTPEQIAEALRLAREWTAAQFKK